MILHAKKADISWLALPVVTLLALFLLVLIGYWAEQTALGAAKQRMENILTFQMATLKASMDKYGIISAVLARRPSVIAALSSNEHHFLPDSSHLSNIITGLSGASDIWIVDKQGKILSGNNSRQLKTNIGSEPYFQAAMFQGVLGRASTVDTNGQRFYIFASPVFGGEDILGVVVVRVTLENIEQVWALLDIPILATDETNRVLLSNIKGWRLRQFYPSSLEKEIPTKSSVIQSHYLDHSSRLLLNEPIEQTNEHDYLYASRYLALLNWRLHVMADYAPIINQRNTTVFISALVIIVVIMSAFMFTSRQRHIQRERRSQQAFALRLERQVRDRTHELTSANQQLEKEIEERRNAEKSLRETQEELIQAAKLAGIGQMSAALAHEYNQPLAAIRSYSDNAITFIDQQNTDAASDNLNRIKMLVDKMANLTKTLKSFVHKPSYELTSIPIDAVMDELIILLSPQAKKLQVELRLTPCYQPLFVRAEHGRLSQVMTNLVTNAMDAVVGLDNPCVEIAWKKRQNNAVIIVKDTGAGIAEDIKDKIFDAFFTTKEPGSGLGLGLFIVMNIIKDFKGSLTVKQEKNYGGVFEITFPLVE